MSLRTETEIHHGLRGISRSPPRRRVWCEWVEAVLLEAGDSAAPPAQILKTAPPHVPHRPQPTHEAGSKLQERGWMKQLLLGMNRQASNCILHLGSLPTNRVTPLSAKLRGQLPLQKPKISCLPFWITRELKWQPATSLE